MHHAAVLDAVQPRVALEGPRAVELQDEAAVVGDHGRGLRRAAELRGLPRLALVFAQVLDDERFDVLDAEQPLARGVDGEAPQVAGDPAAVQLLGHGRGGAAAAEAVEDEVVFVGGGSNDAFEEGFGFLGGVAESFIARDYSKFEISSHSPGGGYLCVPLGTASCRAYLPRFLDKSSFCFKTIHVFM